MLIESSRAPSVKFSVPASGFSIWDSGSTLLGVPSSFITLFRATTSALDSASDLFSGRSVPSTRINFTQWPDLVFCFNDAFGKKSTVKVSPSLYLVSYGASFVYLGLHVLPASLSSTSLQFLLGDVFLQAIYAVYDRNNNRVAFAPIATCVCSENASYAVDRSSSLGF